MTKKLQIGSQIFNYPVQGDGNWAEEATAWAEEVTDVLAEVQGPNDFLITSATLQPNQIQEPISGFVFDNSSVLSVKIEYFIKREGNLTSIYENGELLANYNGASWDLSQSSVGDVGVVFDIAASGQVIYTSSNTPPSLGVSETISLRYRAKTIDEP